MSLKQHLAAFFLCIDCRRFTLTGWSCRICGSRLCFECAGGYAMYRGYSPGFEMCEACKDDNDRAMRANFPIKKGVYGYSTAIQKRRCTEHTPLNLTGTSRRRFALIGFQQIGKAHIQSLCQIVQGFSVREPHSSLNIADCFGGNTRFSSEIGKGHVTLFSPILYPRMKQAIRFSLWSSHSLVSFSLLVIVSKMYRFCTDIVKVSFYFLPCLQSYYSQLPLTKQETIW